jgi:hypothetical protein
LLGINRLQVLCMDQVVILGYDTRRESTQAPFSIRRETRLHISMSFADFIYQPGKKIGSTFDRSGIESSLPPREQRPV